MKVKVSLIVISLLVAGPAAAVDFDYYTYNGFDATVNAFERIALIFASTEYLNFAFVVVVLGMFLGAFSFAGKALLQFGSRGNPLSWFFIVMLGVAIFRSLVIPTGTVHVYDPVRNAYQAVGNVPNLVILVAGGMNKVERAAVELFDSTSAHPYGAKAGGISFELLLNGMTDYSGGVDDQYLVKTLKKYYSDCSQMALVQSSYDFDLNQLRSGTNDFMDLLPKLKSPADYTTVYTATPTGKGGQNVSCTVAWDTYLQPAWSDNTLYTSMMNSVCTRSGFNVGVPVQLARCKDLLDDLNTDVFAFAGGTPEHLLRQMAMANAIASAIQDENPDLGLRALSNRAVMVEGIGIAQSANQWIPTIRAVVLAIVLGLFPILVIFMITPLFTRAIAAMFGLFAWITLWGVADALVHHSAMDMAISAVAEIQRHNMGLTAMLQSPEAALQSLGIFGKARGMGITIASLLSVMIFRMSASGLASMTSAWQGRVDGAGAEAATQTQTPEGSGAMLDRLSHGAASSATAGMMGFGRMANAAAYSQQTSAESQSQTYENLRDHSDKSMSSAAQTMGSISAGASIGNLRATEANTLSKGGNPSNASNLFSSAQQVAETEQSGRFGDADARRETAEDMGFESVQEMNAYVSYIDSLNRGTDSRTHGANIERFQEAYEARTGEHLDIGAAAQMFSRVRNADITGRSQTFADDPGKAESFAANTVGLQQMHQDGLLLGAEKLGVSAFDLAEAGGRMAAARQSGDAKTLGALSMQDIALGSFANQVLSANSGTEILSLMGDRGLVEGTREMLGNELLLRDASSQQFGNLASSVGLSEEDTAMSLRGTNMQLALSGDQIAGLPSNVIDSANIPLAGEGATATINLDNEGTMVGSAQVRTGTQFSSDDSSFVHGGSVVTTEAAGSLMTPGQEDQFERVLRRIDDDTQSTVNLQSSQAAFISQISSSQLSITDSKGAGGSVTGSVTAGTPGIAKGLFGVQASVTAEGHVRQEYTAADTDTYNANLGRVRQLWENADSNAESATTEWADTLQSQGQTVHDHQRQDHFFDIKAREIHSGLSDLVAGDLEKLDSTVSNSVIGAERMEQESENKDSDSESARGRWHDERNWRE